MLEIIINNEALDLYPDTKLVRERSSPFFLVKSSGQDFIPPELSYPITAPMTDRNLRLTNYANLLQKDTFEPIPCVVNDAGNFQAGARLHLLKRSIVTNRQSGSIEFTLYMGNSAFAQTIAGRKLTDLSLGGPRTFAWDGYNASSGSGFWRHCHTTWDYTDCDSGLYVFYPISNESFGGFAKFVNKLQSQLPDFTQVELSSDNVPSLCPHIFLSHVLRAVFEEHGYTVDGDLFDDPDFKTITLSSFTGIKWSDFRINNNQSGWVSLPLSQITFSPGAHLPPNVTIGEFLVEMQKFLPIGFDINEGRRHCKVVWLFDNFTALQTRDISLQINPAVTSETNIAKAQVVGIRRNFNSDSYAGGSVDLKNADWHYTRELADLPIPIIAPDGSVYRIIDRGQYYIHHVDGANLQDLPYGDNINNYEPPGTTDSIDSSMVPMGLMPAKIGEHSYYNGPDPVTEDVNVLMPTVDIPGNWHNKTEQADWKLHIAFYKGKTYPVMNGASLIPFATHSNHIWVAGANEPEPQINGAWAMGYENGNYGLVKTKWAFWLKVLAERETVTFKVTLPLHEYINLSWFSKLIFENTGYILKKITDTLPFDGQIECEAVRKPF